MADQLDRRGTGLHWNVTFVRAARAIIAGDTDHAEQLATEALQIGTDSGQPDASVIFGAPLISISSQRGTLGDLISLIEQAVAENPGIPRLRSSLAMAHAQAGRTDDARRLLEEFSAAEFELPLDYTWLTGMVYYAEAATECRDPQYAQPLLDRLAPWADQWCSNGISNAGPVSHYLGSLAAVLGRYDEADAYFAKSAALNDRMGAKFYAASTDLSWGKMLAERQAPGDTDKARKLLTKAHSAAATHGYANVERRAAEALQHLD